MDWPALRVDDRTTTRETLRLWTQIVGRIGLAQEPMRAPTMGLMPAGGVGPSRSTSTSWRSVAAGAGA
jgi:hypothetical protein